MWLLRGGAGGAGGGDGDWKRSEQIWRFVVDLWVVKKLSLKFGAVDGP